MNMYREDWASHVVHQRDEDLGCIPTGYEWLIRVKAIQGIRLETFQEDFNIQARGLGSNNFVSIAKAVSEAYPILDFQIQTFDTGREKRNFLVSQFEKSVPTLLSLRLGNLGFHIMPILGYSNGLFYLAWGRLQDTSELQVKPISEDELISIHDQQPGGRDIAYL